MRKCKYPMAARLNNKGIKQFGDIFPDGLVPVLAPLSGETELEGIGLKKIYLVNISLLRQVDEPAYQKTLKKLSEKFNVSIEEMDHHLNEVGLPLRQDLVSSVKIDMRFIL